MSIQSQIDRVKNAVSAAYTECNAKGATIPSAKVIENLATCIKSIISPSGTKPDIITTNGTHNVKQYENAVVNVPQGMLHHTRIQKTIGSSDTFNFSIPLSEIGFTPKAYAIVAYPEQTFAKGSKVYLLGLSCDIATLESTGASTAGTVLTAGGVIATVGTSTKGEVNGSNFTFSGTYAYFKASTRYRFFFWG